DTTTAINERSDIGCYLVLDADFATFVFDNAPPCLCVPARLLCSLCGFRGAAAFRSLGRPADEIEQALQRIGAVALAGPEAMRGNDDDAVVGQAPAGDHREAPQDVRRDC